MNIEDIDIEKLDYFFKFGNLEFAEYDKTMKIVEYYYSPEFEEKLRSDFSETLLVELLTPLVTKAESLEEMHTIVFELISILGILSRRYRDIKHPLLTLKVRLQRARGIYVDKEYFVNPLFFGSAVDTISKLAFLQAFKNVYGLEIPNRVYELGAGY